MYRLRTNYAKDLFGLLFPKKCAGCERVLATSNSELCLPCESSLELIEKPTATGSDLMRLMADLNINSFDCFLDYRTGSMAQHLIRQLKYYGREELSLFLAKKYMEDRAENGILHQSWDALVPVPLHPKKLRQRGYNQLDGFVSHITQQKGLQQIPDFLRRTKHLESQTTRNREKRMEKLKGVYELHPFYKDWTGKRVLVIDDVFTTGATTIACTQAIRSVFPNMEIGWLFIAETV